MPAGELLGAARHTEPFQNDPATRFRGSDGARQITPLQTLSESRYHARSKHLKTERERLGRAKWKDAELEKAESSCRTFAWER